MRRTNDGVVLGFRGKNRLGHRRAGGAALDGARDVVAQVCGPSANARRGPNLLTVLSDDRHHLARPRLFRKGAAFEHFVSSRLSARCQRAPSVAHCD